MQAMEEPLEVGERGVQSGLAQLIARYPAVLISQALLERNGLLEMKSPEIAVLGFSLKPRQRLCDGIHCRFGVSLCLLQVGKILPLDSLVLGIMHRHGSPRLIITASSHCSRRAQRPRLVAVMLSAA